MISTNIELKKSKYFALRNVTTNIKFNSLPIFLLNSVGTNKDIKILDIGCGYCNTLQSFRFLGYNNLKGIDISEEAIQHGKEIGINVEKIENIIDFSNNCEIKYDFIILSHVLEHLEKREIIDTLIAIRVNLLNENGKLFIAVPNAQSNTGAYWRYEDFTHNTLFTSGSLIYVLKAAGFSNVDFYDPYSLDGMKLLKRYLRIIFIKLYTLNIMFWNKVTNSSFHEPSPVIFSFELKAICN